MAGDWIKMRRGLRHDPKVVAMARELSFRRDFMDWWGDPVRVTCHENVTEIVTFANVTRVTVASLLDVWSALNNSISSDGRAPFMTLDDLDGIAEIPGFGEAMESVGWVIDHGAEGLEFPNFAEHNSPSKSRRGKAKSDAERAREYRARKRAEREDDESVTASRHVTTEKRREENSTHSLSQGPAAAESGKPSEPGGAGRLDSLDAAVAYAAAQWPQLDPDTVREWWAVRERDDWRKSTGAAIPPGRRVHDLTAWVMGRRQTPAAAGRGGGRAKPSDSVWSLQQRIDAGEAELRQLRKRQSFDSPEQAAQHRSRMENLEAKISSWKEQIKS